MWGRSTDIKITPEFVDLGRLIAEMLNPVLCEGRTHRCESETFYYLSECTHDGLGFGDIRNSIFDIRAVASIEDTDLGHVVNIFFWKFLGFSVLEDSYKNHKWYIFNGLIPVFLDSKYLNLATFKSSK